MLIPNISSIGNFQFELLVVSNSISLSENTFFDKRKLVLIIMSLWYLTVKDWEIVICFNN